MIRNTGPCTEKSAALRDMLHCGRCIVDIVDIVIDVLNMPIRFNSKTLIDLIMLSNEGITLIRLSNDKCYNFAFYNGVKYSKYMHFYS